MNHGAEHPQVNRSSTVLFELAGKGIAAINFDGGRARRWRGPKQCVGAGGATDTLCTKTFIDDRVFCTKDSMFLF